MPGTLERIAASACFGRTRAAGRDHSGRLRESGAYAPLLPGNVWCWTRASGSRHGRGSPEFAVESANPRPQFGRDS